MNNVRNFIAKNLAYSNLIRWCLAGVLLLLPFRSRISGSIASGGDNLFYFLKFIDETIIVFFLPFAIFKIIRQRKNIGYPCLLIGFPICLFIMAGFISGVRNGNLMLVTSLGTFDYIKNFLVVFIYAAFFNNFSEVKKIFHMLLTVAIILGSIAFVQELWATGLRYIMGNDITEKKIYMLTSIATSTRNLGVEDFGARWRYGIYRAESLMGDSFVLGLYSMLFLTCYIFFKKKRNFAMLLMMFSGVFVSVSRILYTALVIITGVFLLKKSKWGYIALIPLLILFMYISFETADMDSVNIGQQSFRSYTREKSLEIWKDHPWLGVGAGMYGGVISTKFGSHIYCEYNFHNYHLVKGIFEFGSMDQFWPQILAETGIIGTSGFVGILISLILMLISLRNSTSSSEERRFLTGLINFCIVIFLYLLGSGLNITPVLYTYLAFAGMALGSIAGNKDEYNQINEKG